MEKFIPYQSEQLDQLYTALAKTQSEMRDAELNGKNPHFKSEYADLTSVVKCSRPALTKNGLSVIQQIMIDPMGQTIMQTRLCHASGQWIESRVPIKPEKESIQSLGSYISYLRRYSYNSLIGVVDQDDDGEATMERSPAQYITEEQAKLLVEECSTSKDLFQLILARTEINDIRHLPKEKYPAVLDYVRKVKATKEKKQ